MHARIVLLLWAVCLTGLLAACGGAAAPNTASDSSAPAVTDEYLRSLELVNARTGETFKLSDFAGKTVWFEPMATWCINCRRQMKTLIDVLPQVDPDKVVFVGVSVAENVDNATLAKYVDDQGFTWLFAVATPDTGKALIDRFGQTAVTPPNTPHIIISPDGKVSELMTGYQDAPAVIALVNGA